MGMGLAGDHGLAGDCLVMLDSHPNLSVYGILYGI